MEESLQVTHVCSQRESWVRGDPGDCTGTPQRKSEASVRAGGQQAGPEFRVGFRDVAARTGSTREQDFNFALTGFDEKELLEALAQSSMRGTLDPEAVP
jgi:hypothetical protein